MLDCEKDYLLRRKLGSLAIVFASISFILLLVFRTFPQLDILFANAFYDPSLCASGDENCVAFIGLHNKVLIFFREVSFHGMRLIGLLTLIAAIIVAWRYKDTFRFNLTNRSLVAAGLSLVLGPIIVTNWIFKNQWGRPRPYSLEQFGGDNPFILAGTWSDICPTNCSFVSGEASGIFWLFAFLPIFIAKFGRGVFWPLTILFSIFAGFIAFNRLMFGAHFLSDITLAATITLSFVFFCQWILTPKF